MANPVHLEKLDEGVDVWNSQQSSEYPLSSPDFAGADLRGRDLSRANLVSANFSNANLQGAILGRGTKLRDANFHHANLSRADLSGADLQDAHFDEADLRGATFRDANLLGAHLREAVGGLRTEQYAGADLTGAELPKPLEDLYGKLENVKGISDSARKIFLAVLAACLYCWLTIATTTDVNLITNRNSSALPIIQTPIPIVGFYIVAPLLVLCVYFYFHFYLQKMWEELGSMPAVFPDGRPLYSKVDPWLLNDLVRTHLSNLNADRPFLSYLQLWLSVVLAWWIVPATILLFWWRYLSRREAIGTAFHVVLLTIALVSALRLHQLAVSTLCGRPRQTFTWRTSLQSSKQFGSVALALAVVVLFGCLSWRSRWNFVDALMLDARANLDGAEVSQKKSSWDPHVYREDAVIGAQLRLVNLRFAQASNAFLAGANLEDADLTYASLGGADLRGAHLENAKAPWIELIGANLAGANLALADLRGADLRDTSLEGAELGSANLAGADFSGSDLSNAKLMKADLTGARLNGMVGTMPYAAELNGAWLIGAKGLIPGQVKSAKNWEKAFYDNDTRKALGLPTEHNGKLMLQLEDEKLKKEDLQRKQNAEPKSAANCGPQPQ